MRIDASILIIAAAVGMAVAPPPAMTGATRINAPAGHSGWKTLTGETRTQEQAEAALKEAMNTPGVSALSVAVVQDGRVVYERVMGVVDRKTNQPAGPRTVMRAASLSKPVFSYLVMKLADEGLFSLDDRLVGFTSPPFTAYPEYASVGQDPRHQALTAAMMLTHTGGFPNWRRPRVGGPLPILFDPGDEFSYSGEGYYLLQFLLEKKTGRDLATLAREKVFAPLGMARTSFLWETVFDGDFAVELDAGLGPLIRKTRTNANSAGSLLTNAADYARFVIAAMKGQGLKPETSALWRKPRLRVFSKVLHVRERAEDGNAKTQLSWTPGWGWFQSPAGGALFHLGQEEGCENYVVVFPAKSTALVVFSVTEGQKSITPGLAERLIGDVYSPFSWMRY